MQFNKKSTVLGVFLLGAIIFATSAFADILLGSGYFSLKDSAKATMTTLANDADNFSIDVSASIKVDGKPFTEFSNNLKYDNINQARESNEISKEKGELRKSYVFNDRSRNIYKNFEDDSYSVVEKLKSKKDNKIFENPFEDEHVNDAEKIMDAFVGSLKDVIQIDEINGNKIYVGNISDSEVPPLINAVSSFAMKYSIFNEREAKRLDIPYPKSNIYVIDASGKAIENEDGILESGIFTASMSADDNNGKQHIYSVEFSIDIKDVNSTSVSAPDLDGKKVTYSKEGFEFDSKFVGKYKNDIIKVTENSFVKQGERIIEINSVDGGIIKGRYYELYNEGHEADEIRSFKFSSKYNESSYYTIIDYIENSEKKTGVIHRTSLQNINVSFDVIFEEDYNGYSYQNYEDNFDSNFIRVFE